MFGIDISNHQRSMDLKSVLQNTPTDFVIVKATEGTSYIDQYMERFVDIALSMGKLVMIYHFARPERNTAMSEASFFWSRFKKYKGKAVPCLDWESSGASKVAWAKTWLNRVAELSGSTPVFYTYQAVENKYDFSPITKYPLWIAKYKDHNPDYNYDMSNAGSRPVLKHWKNYVMWQWTSSGRLDGYSGNLDCNEYYGTVEQWRSWIGGENPVDVFIQIAEAEVGYHEGTNNKNKYGDLMHSIQPSNMDKNAPWCDAFVDFCVLKTCEHFGYGAETARKVLCGDFDDYTYNSVALYKKASRWTQTAQRGAQVFFGGSGHTGIVYKVDGGRVYTIEGNKSDQVKKCDYAVGNGNIIGYGLPRFDLIGTVVEDTEEEYENMPLLKKGSQGRAVIVLQAYLGFTGEDLDGSFGNMTRNAVIQFQKKVFPNAPNEWDGEVGDRTWNKLIKSL